MFQPALGRLAVGLLVGCLLHAPGMSVRANEALDAAFDAFWAADSDETRAAAVARIVATNPELDEVRTRLMRGRTYRDDVPTGRQLRWRSNRDGLEHGYLIHVPETYDPGTRYPVRVYLHGGVMRPLREDGTWWPNDEGLARNDSIAVLPASWSESLWWQESQIENLAGVLVNLKRVYNIDENRVHMLGISDGATGAFYHAFKATTLWAGFVPLNGHPVVLANPASDVDGDMHVVNLRSKPFFIVNGIHDRLYPASSVERFVRLFVDAGVQVDFRPQESGHDMQWWPDEVGNIDAFIRDTPRVPLPDRLSWETERTETFNRAHWLVISELGSVSGEPELEEFNMVSSPAQRVPLGITMLGELQNRSGLRIFEVGPGSIAARAGMAVDDIILEIDGVPTPTVDAFRELIVGFAPGQELPLTVERAGVRVPLTLRYPADEEGASRVAFPQRAPSGRVDLERDGNTVTVSTRGVRRFTLLLSQDQFDFSQPIRVVTNGTVSHDAMVTPDLATLLQWAARDQDRTLLIDAALEIVVG